MWLKLTDDSIVLQITARPNASKSEFAGIQDGRLKIRLKAPPVDGAANKALIAFLNKQLKTAKNAIIIIKGHTSRSKTVSLPRSETAENLLKAIHD